MVFVYFVSANGHDGPIKIGHTSGTVARRVQLLQTGNPQKLRVLETLEFQDLEDAVMIEKMLHEKLATRRLIGEWFAATLRQCLQAVSEIADDTSCSFYSMDPDSLYLDVIPLSPFGADNEADFVN